ncbi:MAG: septum formation protein [Pelagibacterales bacterium]|jgi:septum formation protein|nr:septum formation protein [Pelagibacterales bacterium]
MKIILASKSKIRKKILMDNNISCDVVHSNVDEDQAKDSLIEAGADPLLISKNLAELKSIKISKKFNNLLVLGADSVISLDDKLINKPDSREEALEILKKLNGSTHYLISSICVSKNGSMVWNHTDSSELKMKRHTNNDLIKYLNKIATQTLLDYGVYQIEAGGLKLFENIKGDLESIMGLPIKQLKQYLNSLK